MSISSGTYVNATPTGTVTIEGTAAERQTLTAVAATLADADGLGPLSWQWLRDGVVITGATASTYQLALEDVGHALSVRASYVDDLGQAESVTSAATASVRLVNMAPTFQRYAATPGTVIVDIAGYTSNAQDVLVQPDGKIVLTGYGYGSNWTYGFAAVRLNADGTLDTGFSGDGKTVFSISGEEYGLCAVLQPDGKIVMAGQSWDFSLARLNADGTLDTSFSGDGKALFDVNGFYDCVYGITLQPDGKIVVAGTGNVSSDFNSTQFSLMRLNADGTLDTSFSGDGKATIDIRQPERLGLRRHAAARRQDPRGGQQQRQRGVHRRQRGAAERRRHAGHGLQR